MDEFRAAEDAMRVARPEDRESSTDWGAGRGQDNVALNDELGHAMFDCGGRTSI